MGRNIAFADGASGVIGTFRDITISVGFAQMTISNVNANQFPRWAKHQMHDNVIENSSSHMADYLAHNLLDSPQQEVEPAFAVPPVEPSPEVEVEAVEEEAPKRKRRSLKGSSNLYCRIDQRTHLDLKLYALMEERSMSEIVNEALQSHVPKMNAPYQRTTA